jgi:uncharacterized protein with von Willebrand factor type A (vWA) domain
MKNVTSDPAKMHPANNVGYETDILLGRLVEFIHSLRRCGIRISISETMDALNALAQIDFIDQDQVRIALGATLVKSQYDRKVFEKAFDDYFSPPEIKMQGPDQRGEGYADAGSQPEEAGGGPVSTKKESDRDWGKEFLDHARQSVEQNEKMSIKPGWTKRQKKQFIETITRMRGDRRSDGPSAPLARKAGNSLEQWHEEVKQQVEQNGPAASKDVSSVVREELDKTFVSLAPGSGGKSDSESIMYEDMKKIAEKDLPRVALLIKKLSRRLATRISRRYLKRRRRGRLDIRRSIRKNISFGGTLIDLKYHSKKVQKPRIVLICDVSGSMARYAVFVIQFIFGLSDVVKGIESFIFSEDLERVTPYFKKGEGFVSTMSCLVEKSGQWGMGTNLYHSLVTFLEKHQRLLSPSVFVLIVSDAQTIQPLKAAACLKEIRSRVKDVIWLNTLPKESWYQNMEIYEFLKYCRMFECSTLDQLNKVLSSQMLTV